MERRRLNIIALDEVDPGRGHRAGVPIDVPSPREIEVLQLVADGLENEQIARTLYVAPATVKHHVHACLARLQAENRTHAVAIALRRGLIR